MSIDQIIETLNQFVPFPEDDPNNETEKYLYNLMEVWKKAEEKEKAIASIFGLMEKYPHADFGSPGPLVHALESLGVKKYESALQISLMRKPVALTIWMYNRIINVEKNPAIIKAHISRLQLFAQHPFADAETKEEAEGFLDFQRRRLQSLR